MEELTKANDQCHPQRAIRNSQLFIRNQKTTMKYLLLLLSVCTLATNANAFCGFYVAKADAKLFNKSSQVIMARDGNHTVITMSNDFQGSVEDFAMVVPVPEVLLESDIRVVNQAIFDKFDAYTSPRLVEYYDQNPCYVPRPMVTYSRSMAKESVTSMDEVTDDYDAKDLGVTVEATYTVGEYDILILSAKESGGLKTWLKENGYKLPRDAEEVLDPYIQDGMKFFVVKVNLDLQAKSGFSALRPLQIQFNSDRFMLPIRLGMANAEAEQDLIVYTFTKNGRVETANYRTTKLPTDREIPVFVKEKGLFPDFYKSTFEKAWRNEGRNSVMLEYAWNVTGSNPVKCDPCNTPAVTFNELREAGVWWIQPGQMGNYQGQLFVTRLHVRYGREKFPQDLAFIATPNMENFQGRYVVRHEATGPMDCDEGKKYKRNLALRKKKELDELVALTGWSSSKYRWYLGDAAAEPVKKLPEPLQKQPEKIADSPVKTDVQPVGLVKTPETNIPDIQEPEVVAINETTESDSVVERDAFMERAQQEARVGQSGTTGWLAAGALGMFLLGMLVRNRFAKKES